MPAHDPRLQARRAVEREPQHAIAWIVLSDAELDAGDAHAGRAAAERALALAPGHPEALARLGRAHWMLGEPQAAAASLRAASRNAPQHPGIAVWLGHVLEDIGEAEAASEAYARAYALEPGNPLVIAYLLAWRRRLCDWRDVDRLSGQVRDAVRHSLASIEPFAFLSEDSTAAEQLQCARLRAGTIASAVRPLPPAPLQAGGPIRIGFLSNGFGAHPTGLLVVAFLEALAQHADVEAHLFALNPDDGSDIRRRLHACARVHDVARMPHDRVAAMIRHAGTELLFDLRGWGGGGTPEVLALRPAPLQVNWLAYPGTSGAPWIDYVLADAFVLPPPLEPHFSERVLHLPRCFQPSDTTREIAAPGPRSAYGLPAHGVVLCCFNNSYKLNPASFSRAMRVLAGVEDSVLWLLSGPGRSNERLREAARSTGIEPHRLVFMDKQPQHEYLTRLQLADLFLDTNPYNAHTTASDALWAGCPVLTRPGATFASRVAGSLNHHLGMEDMNVTGDAEFVALATALGRDAGRLGGLRQRLREAKAASGLFDMAGFARDFAGMAQTLVDRHRRQTAGSR